MQKPLKHFLVVATILGILALIANVLVDNPYTHRVIRNALNRGIQDETNLIVDFKAIKASVVPPGVDLYGVQVAPKIASQEPLFTSAQVKVRISLWALVLGDIRIGLIEAQEPTVFWPPPWNFPGFLTRPQTAAQAAKEPLVWPPPFAMPVDRIILNQARLALSLPLKDTPPQPLSTLDATVEGLDLDVTWKNWEKIDAAFQVRSVNLALGGVSFLEETAVKAELSLRGTKLTLENLETDGERLQVKDGRGSMLIVRQPDQSAIERFVIETSAHVDADLSLLGSFLDLPDTHGRIKGQTSAAITIPVASRDEVAFKIKGEAEAQDAWFFNYRLFNSRVLFEVDPKAITFPNIDLVIDKTRYAQGEGILRFDENLSFEWNIKPERLRLFDLLNALGVDFREVDGALIAEDLKIIGRGDPFDMKVSAHAQFSDLVLPETPYNHRAFATPPQCRLDLHLMINEEQIYFDGTSGLCFQTKESISLSTPKAPLVAPPNATASSPVTVSGGVHFTKGMGLTVSSSALDFSLANHFATVPMTGKGQVTALIRGPFDHVEILSRVDTPHLELRGMPLGHVRGEALIDSERVLWKDVQITPPGASSTAYTGGSLDFDDALTLRTQLRAENLKRQDLEEIMHAAIPDLELSFGIDRLEADVEGPLLSPLAMTGRFVIDATQVMQGQETLADKIHATVRAKPTGISTEDLRVQLGSLAMAGKLRHKRARPFTLQDATSKTLYVSLGILPEDQIEATVLTTQEDRERLQGAKKTDPGRTDDLGHLPYIKDALAKAGIKGAVNLRAKIAGQLATQFQGTIDGGVTQFELLGSRLAPIGVNGFIKGGRLDLMLSHSGNALEGRLSMDFAHKEVPFEWFLSMHRLDLRALGSHYFYEDPRNYLYLTADWHMAGHLGDFWRSKGELEIKGIRGKYVRDLAAQTKTIMITQEKPVTLRFAKEGWSFDGGESLRLGGRYVNFGISMAPSTLPEHLGIQIDGTIDMAMAKDLSQDVDTSEGQVHVTALIGGPIQDPSLKIDLSDLKPTPFTAGSWRPVTFGLADMRPALRNIKLAAHYNKGRLAISSFLADKGSGTISASGSLGLTDEADEGSRLDVTLSDATLIYTVAFLKSFETQVSGNVSLSGRGFPYKISGGINVTKARSTKEVDIRNEIINVLRQKSFSAQVVQEKPSFLFDLKIGADQTIHIHNKNLQTVLSTNLSLQGSDIAPQLLGQVEVNKGRFIYKRDFQIQRGLVIFDDPVRPDPNLDILAASEVDNYRVYIAITGRASTPTVEFSIDPPSRESGAAISKLEILVLLSRGKLPEENRSLGQETQSAAASEAANLILGQFEEPVEKLFELSGQNVVRNVYIDTYPSPDGGPVPRLNLPLDLGEDFDIVLRADGKTNQVSTEYNVHDNINFSGVLENRRSDEKALQTRQQGVDFEAKVGLKFRFSFE